MRTPALQTDAALQATALVANLKGVSAASASMKRSLHIREPVCIPGTPQSAGNHVLDAPVHVPALARRIKPPYTKSFAICGTNSLAAAH